MDPKGIDIDLYSTQWCDPTKDAGYALVKEPTLASKEGEIIKINRIFRRKEETNKIFLLYFSSSERYRT